MEQVEVTAGTIEYGDTRGDGRPLVFLSGLAMDGRLWDGVVAELRDRHRCLTPTLPLGSHRVAMRPDADLSLVGISGIVAELLERLELRDAVVCFNDWGGAQTLLSAADTERVGALVLVSCETAGNYPPGLAGRAASLSAKLPGGLSLMRATILARPLRRLPMVYGQMSKRGVPDRLLREWLEPLRRAEIRRDLAKYVGDVRQGRREIRAASAALASFPKPVLVVWDAEGKMMPNAEGRRLADSFPDSTYVELPDCFTLVPIDQPQALAAQIRNFTAA
ncbi:MAG: alpha/beta fold hydrolase [Solirubrobacterales bacterium]